MESDTKSRSARWNARQRRIRLPCRCGKIKDTKGLLCKECRFEQQRAYRERVAALEAADSPSSLSSLREARAQMGVLFQLPDHAVPRVDDWPGVSLPW